MTKFENKALFRKLDMCESDLDTVLETLTKIANRHNPEMAVITSGKLNEAIEYVTQAAHAMSECALAMLRARGGCME